MTLSTTTSRVSYPGTGSVGPFVFPFKITAETDLLVIKRSALGAETILAWPTGFTVTGVGDASGNVTLVTALATGETIFIRRKPPLTQTTSIRNQGAYFPATIEDEFDRLTMQLQSLQDQIDRSVKLKESVVGGIITELEPTVGYVVTGTGSGFTTSPLANPTGVALPGGTRTVTTLSAYLANNAVFQLADWFPAVYVPGVTDATVALQACIDAANGAPVILPQQTTLFSTVSNVPGRPLTIWGQSRGNSSTVLQTTNAANVAIKIAQTASSFSGDLRDFVLAGSALNIGGIIFGTAAWTASFYCLSKIQVINFTGTGSYGLSLNKVQEFDGENVYLSNNYFNIWRPNVGSMTSVAFHGAAGYCGNSINAGVQMDGAAIDLRFYGGMVFESTNYEAIRSVGPKVSMVIDGCYFENCCKIGGDVITISGSAGVGNFSTLILKHTRFVAPGRVAAHQLNLDWVQNTRIESNIALFASGVPGTDVVVTANTQAHFEDNAFGADIMPIMVALQATAPKITWEETSLGGLRMSSGREIGLAGSATALVEDVHSSSLASFGWVRRQDEITTGDQMEYSRISGVETMVLRKNHLTGQMQWARGQVLKRVIVTYAASVAIDCALGNEFDVTANNATAFNFAFPANSQDGMRITITVRNTSGGALGAVTFDASFKLAAWTSPATGNSRSIDFRYNGTNWVEVGRTTVDVPN